MHIHFNILVSGFRNTSSQIAASFTADGKYVICASEDAQVFVWRHDIDISCPGASSRNKSITHSYENFHCRDVTVAIPWPHNLRVDETPNDGSQICEHDTVQTTLPPKIKAPSIPLLNPPKLLQGFKSNKNESLTVTSSREVCNSSSPLKSSQDSISANNLIIDKGAATWPEEKLAVINKNSNGPISYSGPVEVTDGSKVVQVNKPSAAAWGMVILTAGVGGEIRTYQNFGIPFRV